MGDVEEEGGAESVLLGPRREHPLGDVAAAAGLGAGVPDGPPLHGHGHHEDGHGQLAVVGEVGKHGEIVDARSAPVIAETFSTNPVVPPTSGSVTAK